MELLGSLTGDFRDGLVERQAGVVAGGAIVDLVVDVRDVADVLDRRHPVGLPEQAIEHVEDNDRPRIADMGEVVDGRPAHVHAHVGRVDRPERLPGTRQRVVENDLWRSLRHTGSPLPTGRGRPLRYVRERRLQPAMMLAANEVNSAVARRSHDGAHHAPGHLPRQACAPSRVPRGVARLPQAPTFETGRRLRRCRADRRLVTPRPAGCVHPHAERGPERLTQWIPAPGDGHPPPTDCQATRSTT
jgi:hypothetical protein